MSHRLTRTRRERLFAAVPFGLGQTKPRHFRDMLRIVWLNRDNLGYAWKVITRGVCDGCALGVAGLHDWTIDGVHLCMTRLNLLRLNTMPPFDPALVADVAALAARLADGGPRSPRGGARPAASPYPGGGPDFDNARLRELGRIPCPLLRCRGDRGFRRLSWEEALDRIAHRLRDLDGRRFAFFVTARGVTNEVYYMAQKVARFLGTNNVDNAARLCHAPSTGAMKHALGVSASTCSYKDWYGTDLIVFFGANPANDQPVTTKYLHEARQLGTRVALVNPYLEPGMRRYWVPSTAASALFGTDIADWWFPVSQGGDIAFLYGVLKILIERGWLNETFIRDHTNGWADLERETRNQKLETLEAQSGLSRAAMEEFAVILRDARNAVFVWSMGITQHAFGGDAVSMVLNLGLARGYVGREKNGLMPIRGHSSVQGGAEMGAYSTALPGGKPLTPENCAALAGQYGFPIPTWPGLTAVEMVEACARGQLDVLYCLGGNFLRTLPEPAHVAHALANVPLRVHQDIILTDQMFLEPREEVLLLPAKTRYEQDDGGIETTTERRIAFSPEIPRVVGEARAEWKILRDLAAAVHPERAHLLGGADGWKLREEIARVVPFYDGCQDLRKTGDAVQYGGPRLCDGGVFPTADGQAHFRVVPLPPSPVPSASQPELRGTGEPTGARESPVTSATSSFAPAEGERTGVRGPPDPNPKPETRNPKPDSPRRFVVSTRRGKQFNTLIYDEVDPLTGAARDAVFIHPEDAAELRLARDDRVALVNEVGRFEGRVFPVPIARGNLQIHWPEGNVIIARDAVDPTGGVPDYNAMVRVERIG